MIVEAFLSYCLFSFGYVLPSGPEDRINTYVFPLAFRLARGKKLLLRPLYLGSFYAQLDNCIRNVTFSVGRYDVVTHVDSAFHQIFLWESFGNIAPKSMELT